MLSYVLHGLSGINRHARQDWDALINLNYSFNQHYGKCNEQIKDNDFIETAQKVIQELNKVNKETK